MSRSPLLFLALVCLLTTFAAGAEQRPPNVVFILADDLGWADLGCYGSTFYETPNIDRLASQSVRFTQAYAACPVCSPTRASILTGKYPARLRLTDWLPGRPDMPSQRLRRPAFTKHLPLEEVTLAEALQDAGYATGDHRQVAPRRAGVLPGEAGLRRERRRLRAGPRRRPTSARTRSPTSRTGRRAST